MRHARKPARVKEEDSETPYMTRRGIDFIREAGDEPWCLHLSYIKPHWPYIAPAPYNTMYCAADVIPVVRSDEERAIRIRSFERSWTPLISKTFSRDEVREEVDPGLHGADQADRRPDGRAVPVSSKENGYFDNTMIVFTSDHGDYLGDHWLGEKEFFHEPSVKIPLIIYDPSAAADATRGTICDELVEAIDLAPTFLEVFGGDPAQQSHRLEGRSLLPLLHGQKPAKWRDYVISEYDYSIQYAGVALGVAPADSRLFMVADKRWKYVHCHRLPADAVRSASPTRRSCTISAPIRPMKTCAQRFAARWPTGGCARRSARPAPSSRSATCAARRSGAAS